MVDLSQPILAVKRVQKKCDLDLIKTYETESYKLTQENYKRAFAHC